VVLGMAPLVEKVEEKGFVHLENKGMGQLVNDRFKIV
jgi:hypothetical protein